MYKVDLKYRVWKVVATTIELPILIIYGIGIGVLYAWIWLEDWAFQELENDRMLTQAVCDQGWHHNCLHYKKGEAVKS